MVLNDWTRKQIGKVDGGLDQIIEEMQGNENDLDENQIAFLDQCLEMQKTISNIQEDQG